MPGHRPDISTVALERCCSYSPDEVDAAVGRALRAIGCYGEAELEGKRVLIKPNLASAKHPSRCITTHPAVVGAVISCLKSRGAHVAVGDSPAGAVRGVRRVWSETGMIEVCRERRAELVNLEESGWEMLSAGGRSYPVARAVLGFDYIVNVPKLKTHVLTLMTGAIKNMFGCVPGFQKSALHLQFPRPGSMSSALVDVFSLARPWITLVDAVDAMEGNGPSSGSPRHLGLVAASDDCTALDTVLAGLLGIDPKKVPTTREAARRGLGQARREAISVVGTEAGRGEAEGFKVPANWKFFLIPGILGSLVGRLVWVRPLVETETCSGCGDCVRMCAAGAIALAGGRAVIDRSLCTCCLCCQEACSEGAVQTRMSRLARLLA
jgi:uncharacterized protein (DUF362 family)/Pyruvate/2-oxoacid:ferredoxin oxidoreductase delta subunit